VSKKVSYQFALFKGDEEITPELGLLAWITANSSSELKLVVDYFKIPANQTSDLSLGIVPNTSAKLILLHDPTGSIDSTLKAKVNGGSTEYSIAPDLLMSEALSSVSVTNDSSSVKEIYIYSIISNGVVASNVSTVSISPTSTFLELLDSPTTYSGQTGKLVAVNSGETALEFISPTSGDVVGPASSTDNAVPRFDSTTGKLLQNSGVTVDDSGNLTANNISGTNTGDQDISGLLVKASNLSDLVSASTARTNLGLAIGSDVQAWSTILDNTTASYTTTEETKLSNIEALADVTDEANVVAALDGATLTSATVSGTDKVIIQDVDDSNNIKTVTAQSIADLVTGAVTSVNSQTGVVVLDADDIDDTSTINKFVTSSDLTTLSNTSGTNTGDQDLSGLMVKSNNLSDLTNTSTARTNLGVDAAGTDNSTDVTLDGTPDYITITGQTITRNAVDLTTDVTGDLPVTEGGTGASDASTARTNLGLAIGTNVQAYNANLTTWAGKTAPSGTVVGTSDSQTLTAKTLTDMTISGDVTFTETDDGNSSTADTIDWGASLKHKSTLTGNCTYTFTAPTGPCNLLLKVIQDATGSRTATWPASVKWAGGAAPTLSTAASAIDIISFYYDGTNYYGQAGLAFS